MGESKALNSLSRANFRHLYADVFWYGVLAGSTMAFLAIYATRLGANSFQISLLTAAPALINLLFSLPAGRWLENRHFVRVTFWAAAWHRLGYLLLIPLPLLFTPTQEIWVIVLITAIMTLPGVVLAIGFNALFAEITPPAWRGEVVGKRNALLAVSMTTVSLSCGVLLDRIVFPLNYQIVFGIGVIGALISTYHVGRLRLRAEPAQYIGKPLLDFALPGVMRFVDGFRAGGLRYLTRSRARKALPLHILRGSFGPFMGAYFLFYMFQYFGLPLFPVWYVRGLHLEDWQIGLGSALFHGAMLVASLKLGSISARFGHRKVLVLGGLFFASYPLLLGLASDAKLYFIATLTAGFNFSLVNGGLINRLMERIPPDDLPAHMALHNLALNLGILLGSLSGPLAAEALGVREALFLAAGLRLLGGILLFFLA